MAELPENAKIDLAGNLQGDFSPEDWHKILARAGEMLGASPKPKDEAWVDVILAFHREKYWGFKPNYRKPKTKLEDENLGTRFIWYSFRSFLITKVIVLYCGARWVADYDPIYGYLFFGAIVFMLANYGYFLWKYGSARGASRKDEDSQRE
jgi:hypothetical protein